VLPVFNSVTHRQQQDHSTMGAAISAVGALTKSTTSTTPVDTNQTAAKDPETPSRMVESHLTSITTGRRSYPNTSNLVPPTSSINEITSSSLKNLKARIMPATEQNSLAPANTPKFENLLSNELWTMVLEQVVTISCLSFNIELTSSLAPSRLRSSGIS
jgi:hypothetical protein